MGASGKTNANMQIRMAWKTDFAKKKIAKICMASGKMMPLFVNMKEKESHAFSCLAGKVAISNTKKCAKNTTTLEGSPGP